MAVAQNVADLKNKRRETHELAELLSRLQSEVCSCQALMQYVATELSSWYSASEGKLRSSLPARGGK